MLIYDALAPAAMELSEAYIELDNTIANTFAATCSRDFLILFAEEHGLEVKTATPAVIKLLTTPLSVSVPLDSMFTIGSYNYTITEKLADGEYAATCNQAGVDGGSITADMDIVPVVEINDLETITFDSVIEVGTDDEDTESLRKRYINSLKPFSFGGNVADYTYKTLSIDGVGACRVFRAGDSYGDIIPGGYVTVVILDTSYGPASDAIISSVQNALDPDPGTGKGLAPIGHVVTVETCSDADISITLALSTYDNSITTDIEEIIQTAIERYFLGLRKTWADSTEGIIVRRSQIEELVVSISSVRDCQVVSLSLYGGSDTSHNLEIDISKIPSLHDLTIEAFS